jgi:hypothetical protein
MQKKLIAEGKVILEKDFKHCMIESYNKNTLHQGSENLNPTSLKNLYRSQNGNGHHL